MKETTTGARDESLGEFFFSSHFNNNYFLQTLYVTTTSMAPHYGMQRTGSEERDDGPRRQGAQDMMTGLEGMFVFFASFLH